MATPTHPIHKIAVVLPTESVIEPTYFDMQGEDNNESTGFLQLNRILARIRTRRTGLV